MSGISTLIIFLCSLPELSVGQNEFDLECGQEEPKLSECL